MEPDPVESVVDSQETINARATMNDAIMAAFFGTDNLRDGGMTIEQLPMDDSMEGEEVGYVGVWGGISRQGREEWERRLGEEQQKNAQLTEELRLALEREEKLKVLASMMDKKREAGVGEKAKKRRVEADKLEVINHPNQQQKMVAKAVGDESTEDGEAAPSFDWVEYRQKNPKATKAPNDCFFQNIARPPRNRFQEGMKLETPDPRGAEETMCLATVVEVKERWIRLHLDGCDAAVTYWMICDDSSLHPYGYSQMRLGQQLQAPIGSRVQIDRFSKFIGKQLQLDSDGNSPVVCSEDCFRPIRNCFRPKRNYFKPGHLLELCECDLMDFDGQLYPGQVVSVTEDEVEVAFIGWPTIYNVHLPFDSRWLFPVGFAKKIGIPLEKPPPLTKAGKKLKVVKVPLATPPVVSMSTTATRKRGRPKMEKMTIVEELSASAESSSSSPLSKEQKLYQQKKKQMKRKGQSEEDQLEMMIDDANQKEKTPSLVEEKSMAIDIAVLPATKVLPNPISVNMLPVVPRPPVKMGFARKTITLQRPAGGGFFNGNGKKTGREEAASVKEKKNEEKKGAKSVDQSGD